MKKFILGILILINPNLTYSISPEDASCLITNRELTELQKK